MDPEGDRAEGHSYVTVYQQIPADQLRTIFSGEYCDRFARAEGRWYFTERDIRRPLYGDLSKHLKEPQRTFPGPPLLGGPGDFPGALKSVPGASGGNM